MPTNTYVPLATITLSSTDSEVVFSSIPATYRDLIMVIDGTSTSGTQFLQIRFNGDTGNNYSVVRMYNTTSDSFAGINWANIVEIGTSRTNAIVQIMDYSATDKHTTFLSRGNNAGYRIQAHAGRWANTAAVTSVSAIMAGGSLPIGTTASLFGIEA